MDIIAQLTVATEPTKEGISLFPLDLNTTNFVISSILDFSEEEVNITGDQVCY